MKKFKFTIGGSSYSVNVKGIENNVAEIEVTGTPYDIEIEQEIKTSKTPVVLVRKEVKPMGRKDERKPPSVSERNQVSKPQTRFRIYETINKGLF